MAVEKKPAKPAVVKASSEATGDEKDAINKLGLTDEIRARAEELGVSVKDAGGHDLPRFDVEEQIRKAEEAEKNALGA
jgi:hypothetical protein